MNEYLLSNSLPNRRGIPLAIRVPISSSELLYEQVPFPAQLKPPPEAIKEHDDESK